MSYDYAMIYADIASTFAVALMLLIIKIQYKQEKRITRIEDDLYLASDNPTSMPLTKQVYNLQQDVANIREHCKKLSSTMENIKNMIKDYLEPVKK
jgi:tetrahydromethanopterin S-methyltransferase subunit B